MKSNIRIVLFTLVILFLFSCMFMAFRNEAINHVEFNDGKNGIGFYEENPNQIEQSGSWNLIGTTISIDNNWTAVKDAYEWCTGEGTESEPYIIENVTIDAQNSGSCIEIQNSNEYFIIQKCSLYNSTSYDMGIALNNVTHGKVINNYCKNNYYGIYLYHSNNNTVSGNTASNNDFGIYLSKSNNNTVSGNTASNNNYGIELYQSDNNILSGNTASNNNCGLCITGSNNIVSGNIVINNDRSGIVVAGCNKNMVSDNTVNYNHRVGIYLTASNGNVVSGNTANYNSYDGIVLDESDNNMVSGNTVSNNIEQGIYLFKSYYNKIFLNVFINNGLNAKDDGTNPTNKWDNRSVGNYWDDYQGADVNNDGIGDTPYLIAGTGGNRDYFPIWIIRPSIPFGNYFLLFTISAILSLTILEHQKKNYHLR